MQIKGWQGLQTKEEFNAYFLSSLISSLPFVAYKQLDFIHWIYNRD